MQRFSWQTCTICATCAYLECQCQSEKLPWGGGRVRGMVLLEIFIIGLSKMQFPAFSGSELVNQDGILRH